MPEALATDSPHPVDPAPGCGPAEFAARLVDWQFRHGRHDLPWQVRDPYRVWLSEIMLQQTQVSVVIGYFARFIARFPTVGALAEAPLDDVLAVWSGLGYYQRARNLHRCARAVVEARGGAFPRTAAGLAALPGIGPSTAAAIAAFCFDERAAILDGNVQRVLCRVFGIADPVPTAATTRRLGTLAQALLPGTEHIATYTQGLMDLGATVCKPRQPRCGQCPFEADCSAHRNGDELRLPLRKPARRARPQRDTVLLWMRSRPDDLYWLEKRPPQGIWPGLWSLPQFDAEAQALAFAEQLGRLVGRQDLTAFRHAFTHFDLMVHPLLLDMQVTPNATEPLGQWVTRSQALQSGLPAPVRTLLKQAHPVDELRWPR